MKTGLYGVNFVTTFLLVFLLVLNNSHDIFYSAIAS